ncbi:hypothetical protein PFISCL1PPCAC_1059, partial [Pristionchus fissidentatus]
VLFILIAAVLAQWSAWTETPDTPCPVTCGYCGVRVAATRTCTGVCSGPSQRYEECGAQMCLWPNKTCCPGYIKGLLPSREFECVAIASIPAKTTIA